MNVFVLYSLVLIVSIHCGSVDDKNLPKDAPPNCKARLRNLDHSAKRLSIAQDEREGYIVPFESVEVVDDKYCSHALGYISSFIAYKPCLKAFPRQIMSLIITSLKNTNKYFCSPDGKAALVQHSKCFNDERTLQIRLAMNKATVATEYVTANATEKELVPGVCCASIEMVAQGIKDVDRICNKITGGGTGDFLVNAAMDGIRDGMDMICGKYSTMSYCEKQFPELMARIRGVINRNIPFYQHSTAIALIKFIHRMDQEVNIEQLE